MEGFIRGWIVEEICKGMIEGSMGDKIYDQIIGQIYNGWMMDRKMDEGLDVYIYEGME